MSERGDEGWLGEVGVDLLDAGESMQAVAVHGTGAANALSTGASEGKSGVEVFLDIEKSIEVHGWDLLEINVVADVFGLVVRVFRVVSVDEEAFHLGLFLGRDGRVVLHNVVGIQVALHS